MPEPVHTTSTSSSHFTVNYLGIAKSLGNRCRVTPDAAKLANGRVSVDGRCLLGPLAAYRYDTASGTLAPRPELKACHYRTPGQAETASVRVAHLG